MLRVAGHTVATTKKQRLRNVYVSDKHLSIYIKSSHKQSQPIDSDLSPRVIGQGTVDHTNSV